MCTSLPTRVLRRQVDCSKRRASRTYSEHCSESRDAAGRPTRGFNLLRRPGSPAEFTGRTVPLEDVWGGRARQLNRRLATARSLDECLGLLRGALAAPPREPDSVQRAIGAMTAAHGDLDLDWAARHAGLGARQFRRRCLEESGLAPKHLCRVLRFRRACALAARGAGWVRVAGDAGYFDQAHLIRDFREFTGATPMAVFSKTQTASIG